MTSNYTYELIMFLAAYQTNSNARVAWLALSQVVLLTETAFDVSDCNI